METLKVHDKSVEKADAISRHDTVNKLAILFRLMEVILFLNVVISRSCNLLIKTCNISFNLSSDYDLSRVLISMTFLTSPRLVFFIGTTIILVLFSISSGCFSGDKITDFYEEYTEKCGTTNHQLCVERINLKAYQTKKTIRRSRSESTMTRVLHECNRNQQISYNNMKRCTSTKRYRLRSLNSETEMSSDDFRDMVEEFIARQQMFLREEEVSLSSSAA